MFVMDCSRSGSRQFKSIYQPRDSREIVMKHCNRLMKAVYQLQARLVRLEDTLESVLKYQDKDGKELNIKNTFYNLEARCIQHEMDHLEGKLCIDYEKGEYSREKHNTQTMVESDFRTKSDS